MARKFILFPWATPNKLFGHRNCHFKSSPPPAKKPKKNNQLLAAAPLPGSLPRSHLLYWFKPFCWSLTPRASPGLTPHGMTMIRLASAPAPVGCVFPGGCQAPQSVSDKEVERSIEWHRPNRSLLCLALEGERTGLSSAPGPQDSQPPRSDQAARQSPAQSSPDLGPGPHSPL